MSNTDLIIRARVQAKEIYIDGSPFIVCNNDNYKIQFEFDQEWADHNIKTARFIAVVGKESSPTDVVFTGNECPIPKLIGIEMLYIGLFAGESKATCKTSIACRKSILCDTPPVPPPTPTCYEQILELFENVHGTNAWVRFSDQPDGSNFTEKWREGQQYIGFVTAVTPPTDKAAYIWTYIPRGPQGPVGAQGPQGPSGNSPYIGANGNWWIGGVDTGVLADASRGASKVHYHSADDITSGVVPIIRGGTGASDVEQARKNLEVYSTSEVDNAVGKKADKWVKATLEDATVTINVSDKTEYYCPNATNVTINCPTNQPEYECWIYIGGHNASFNINNATKIGAASKSQYNSIESAEISIKDGRYVVGFSGEEAY